MLITTKPDQAWPSVADCAARLGWTDFARLAAMRQISPRLVRPPFTGQFDHGRQMELWQAEVNRLSAARQPEGIARALRGCEAALATAPDDGDLWSQVAQLRGLSGDGAGAMVAQRRALEQRPGDAEGWAQLGRLLARGRQFPEAVDAFAAAARLDPLSVMAQDGLAQSHSALGQHQAALRIFRQVLAKNPRLGLVWLHRGQTHEKLGETAAAEECYQKAVAHPGSNLSGLLELAAFCQSRGRSEPAANLYLKAVELDPRNAEVRVGAAQHLAIIGRREEAEQHAAVAVALAPKFAEAHVLYGTLLGQRGEQARAREQFQLALQGNPELLDAKLNLGLTLISDEPAAALALFEEVLQRNPAHHTAAKAAAECRKRIEGDRFNN
jgi:tetratricopeptide (TPR) repeat protein